MGKTISYTVVSDANLGHLQDRVNELTEGGWKVAGGLEAIVVPKRDECRCGCGCSGDLEFTTAFYQSMTRAEGAPLIATKRYNEVVLFLLQEIYHLRREQIRPGELSKLMRLKKEFMEEKGI